MVVIRIYGESSKAVMTIRGRGGGEEEEEEEHGRKFKEKVEGGSE